MEKKRIRTTAVQPKQQTTNLTGIPTQTKLEFETRSGFSFADVRVHYHSDKPAKIGAQAYTQGTQVYIGPGQELYLRHELGHVIQQKQGRVGATASIGGAPINDQIALEREADLFASSSSILPPTQRVAAQGVPVIQMTRWRWNAQAKRWEVFASDQHHSNPPTRPGLEDGEIVDTSVSAHLYNYITHRDGGKMTPPESAHGPTYFGREHLGMGSPVVSLFQPLSAEAMMFLICKKNLGALL